MTWIVQTHTTDTRRFAVQTLEKTLLTQVGSRSSRRYRAARNDDATTCEVYLGTREFQDLGEPDTITVTVEPGDPLN